jgi:hypothetical protein
MEVDPLRLAAGRQILGQRVGRPGAAGGPSRSRDAAAMAWAAGAL